MQPYTEPLANEKLTPQKEDLVIGSFVKFGDQYGVYFYRVKGGTGKKYSGWQEWSIKGDKSLPWT